MARELSATIHVQGNLKLLDPLHAGSGKESVETDMAVAVDGQGRVYVAGTALAGALRHWCEQRFESSLVEVVWGYQKTIQTENGKRSIGAAAHLFVEDAFLLNDQQNPWEIRDHVGLDREFGTAAEGIKFDRAVVPPGYLLEFGLTLEVPKNSTHASEARAMLGHLLQALKRGEIRFGAAKTRGLGRLQLEGERIHDHSWSRDGLHSRLMAEETGNQTIDGLIDSGSPEKRLWPRVSVEIEWEPALPTMVKSGIDGVNVDMVPLLGRTEEKAAPLIPGSSFKGAFRSQAERILRTLFQLDPKWLSTQNPRTRFLEQLEEFEHHSELSLIARLFGSRGNAGQAEQFGQGAVYVSDCYSRQTQPMEAWNNLYFDGNTSHETNQEREFFESRLHDVGRSEWQRAFHVAIDRWTGGASDTALYQVLEPIGETWSPFRLEIELGRIAQMGESQAESRTAIAAWVLVLMTLRDLAQQRIPIGFGGNRGLGEIQVKSIQLTPTDCQMLDFTEPITLEQGLLEHLPNNLRKQWSSEWQAWLNEQKEKTNG